MYVLVMSPQSLVVIGQNQAHGLDVQCEVTAA